ncbi:MAG TPA: DegQ family serine endoprotease [Terriglobia bacterium]|nr:DegQ family serine endoprotease [Terriglobia bacterium]
MSAGLVRRPRWPMVLTVVVSMVIGGAVISSLGNHSIVAAGSETHAAKPSDNAAGKASSTTFASAVKKVAPSVVSVFSSRSVKNEVSSLAPFSDDPLFQRFFGDTFKNQAPAPREREERSLGSGVIISSDGYIVTNNHVIDGASDVKVSLNDRREYTARVIGADSKTDLAVLKIDQTGLPALSLPENEAVEVGDVVLAVGNPFGVGQTVTMGIVSATGRGGLGIEAYEDFIQTDAAINPGNSGGALVDAEGRLIGISTAILSRSGGNQGIGFAIPARMVHNISDQIIHNGKVSRAYLGVMIQPVTPDLAKAFKTSKAEGALISDVSADSPAERAGLKSGDIVTKVDDRAVEDSRALQLMIGEMPPGRSVKLTVLRDGAERLYPVTLAEQPAERNETRRATAGGAPRAESALDGVALEPVTPEFSRQFGISRDTKGVAVRNVESGSAAARAGLEAGDVIVEANHQTVATVEQLNGAIKSGTTNVALLLVNHEGRTRYIAVSLK